MSWFFSGSGNAEVSVWHAAVVANGGGFEADSDSIADALISQLKTRSWYGEIYYLLALLGDGIEAAVVPLVDPTGKGNSTNISFLDADFDQAVGLSNQSAASKMIDLPFTASAVNSTDIGLGYCELNWPGVLAVPIPYGNYRDPGSVNSAIGAFDVGERFYSNAQNKWVNSGATWRNGRYYGQSTAAEIKLYRDGALITGASNSLGGTVSGTEQVIGLMGVRTTNGGTRAYYGGTCGYALVTRGTLNATQVGELDSDMLNYLITPTGR